MTAFDDAANRSTASVTTRADARRAREEDWSSRRRELKEEFFSLMDQLADGEISPADAKVETARINSEMATLIRLTLLKRD